MGGRAGWGTARTPPRAVPVAVAAERYARAKKLGAEAERYAAEIVIRAERRMGEILKETPKAQGGNQIHRNRSSECSESEHSLDRSRPKTPRQLAGSKKLSARSQKLAALPEEEFERLLSTTKKPPPEPEPRLLPRETGTHRLPERQMALPSTVPPSSRTRWERQMAASACALLIS